MPGENGAGGYFDISSLISSMSSFEKAVNKLTEAITGKKVDKSEPSVKGPAKLGKIDAVKFSYDEIEKEIRDKYDALIAQVEENSKLAKKYQKQKEKELEQENIVITMRERVAHAAKEETNLYKRRAIIANGIESFDEKIRTAKTDHERYLLRQNQDILKWGDIEAQRQIINAKIASDDSKTRKEGYAQLRQLNVEKAKYAKEFAKKQKDDARNWAATAKAEKEELENKLDSAKTAKERKALAKKIKEKESEIADAEGKVAEATEAEKEAKKDEKKAERHSDEAKKERSEKYAAALNAYNNEINGYIEDAMGHRTKTMARLQGVGGGEYDYDKLLGLVADNLGASPYIKQQDYLKNLDTAVQAGIAYNIEQRTFLASIAESISNTFNAFNAELLRLIRLQQADSTAARLGMEAAIQRGLNGMFEDSSYMTSQYQAVSSALLGAESLMTRNDAVEFEYSVQKWLGALYSLGMSESSINSIAQAINALGTGDVTALSGNTAMQTLFAMSASRSGLDYAQILTNGLNSSDINKLLRSMVGYLQQISEDSKNNVVKSAYKDLLNISLSDLKAVTSLSAEDIDTIYGNTMDYAGAMGSLDAQMSALYKRFTAGEMIKNAIANFKYGIGADIASTPWEYVTWEIADMIRNTTGGIKLPAISVMGNMIDLSAFTVEGIVQSALVGISALGQIGSVINSITHNGGMDLTIWGGKETTSRGGFVETTAGFNRQTSQSQYVGSSSSSDLKNETLSSTTEEAEGVGEITNAGNEPEHTFDDFYNAVFVEGQTMPISLEAIGKNGDEQLYILTRVLFKLGESLNSTLDVNIKSTDSAVPVSLEAVSQEVSTKYKVFSVNELAKAIAKEIKEESLGYTSRDTGTMVADAMRKLVDGDTEIKVTQIFDAYSAKSFGRELIIG